MKHPCNDACCEKPKIYYLTDSCDCEEQYCVHFGITACDACGAECGCEE